VNNKDAGFSLAKTGSFPSGLQSISFADIGTSHQHPSPTILSLTFTYPTDRDGTIDMVFTTCSSVSSSTGVGVDCSINIAYNKQLQLCASSTDSGIKKGQQTCRPPEQLCIADPKFSFDLTDSSDNDVSHAFCFCSSPRHINDGHMPRHSSASRFPPFSQVPSAPLHFLSSTRRTPRPSRCP
jgi:hypothetical protein